MSTKDPYLARDMARERIDAAVKLCPTPEMAAEVLMDALMALPPSAVAEVVAIEETCPDLEEAESEETLRRAAAAWAREAHVVEIDNLPVITGEKGN